ncbi:MAG: hypothetical protein K0Q79_1560 [Flavipsychrobacter sp.]|jgi:hypothetical protein|nr:hypothetical protein [Flavipsychrobacter sp.]
MLLSAGCLWLNSHGSTGLTMTLFFLADCEIYFQTLYNSDMNHEWCPFEAQDILAVGGACV